MITDKAKFERFSKAIFDDADKKIKSNISEAEYKKDAIIKNATEETALKSKEKIERNIKKINSKYKNLISLAVLNSKKELLLKRKELTDGLFQKIEKMLVEFTKSDEYIEFLLKNIDEKYKNNDIVIRLSQRDYKLKEILSEKEGFEKFEFILDESIKIGGVKISFKGKNIVENKTLDLMFEDKKLEFIQNVPINIY